MTHKRSSQARNLSALIAYFMCDDACHVYNIVFAATNVASKILTTKSKLFETSSNEKLLNPSN